MKSQLSSLEIEKFFFAENRQNLRRSGSGNWVISKRQVNPIFSRSGWDRNTPEEFKIELKRKYWVKENERTI